jgi:DMSO/TMAO reductase YedYZ molybdopterin-dependent catalytic subunit
MNARAVNLTILVLVTVEILSGFAAFLVGTPDGRWVFWVHAVGGVTLALLVPWKTAIALRSFARRRWGAWASLPILLSLLFLGSLISGFLWSTTGLPRVSIPLYGQITGLTVHVTLSLALLVPFVDHLAQRWFPPRSDDFLGRRQALRTLAAAAAGTAIWQASEGVNALTSLSGASRRFTGSREEGSFTGNAHPVTNWLSDETQRIDLASWRLRVRGRVAHELVLTYEELRSLPSSVTRSLLDCTGGWFTRQDWRGVRISTLLAGTGVLDDARSLVVRSVTGYDRRFELDDVDNLLLAFQVTGEQLHPAHGFPARLVAPGRRGYNWVKWVGSIEVSGAPPLLQPPLPLQ